jgi:hypothetical protein
MNQEVTGVICQTLYHKKTGKTIYFIWMRRKNDIVTLAHEINHLVFRLFESLGISTDANHSEPFCYLHSYIMNKYLKLFDL